MALANAPQSPEPLAIVGIGCRFPGGIDDPETFWEFLCEGKSAVAEVPEDRWNAERYYSPDVSAAGKIVTKWGGFLDRLDDFDAEFFSITPREASRMDPQQRWLLEVSLEAMEDAHCPPQSLRNTRTGVFVGISDSDYGKIQTDYTEAIDGYSNSGNCLSIASNRISFQFDLKGPSMSVDTACSSGLVAVNLACKSLWSGECDHALAGASNSLMIPDTSFGFSKASMFSPNGKCHAFDSRADGYVRGEGAGMILIKRLSDALNDGNPIYSVIRSSVVNQDGRTSSLTVPSFESQRVMLEESLEMAGISPEKVSYVEAHGTGTPVGDPIEARALGDVLSRGRNDDKPCWIGSVKTNLGHLEPASGLAGIIKAALVLKNGSIPPSLHFVTPNPNIPFDELRLRVVTEETQLPSPGESEPTVVVNSFGFGGANAQAILQAAPAPSRPQTSDPKFERPLVLPLSAASLPALQTTAADFGRFFANSPSDARSICATAGLCREHRQHRLVAIGDDRNGIAETLHSWGDGHREAAENIVSGHPILEQSKPPVFVYSGQGSQWWGMARDLLSREEVFAEVIDQIDAILSPLSQWSLSEELVRPQEKSRIDRTDIAQPALFAIQAGLTAVWKSWGIVPGSVIGHSVGEVAAALAAGIVNLEDATRLVFHRSRLQEKTGGNGRMAAIGISLEEAEDRVARYRGEVAIAAINGPSLVTVSGDTKPVEELVESITEEGKFARWLPIQYAFHCHQMDPIQDDLIQSISFLRPDKGIIPFISTVDGGKLSGESLGPDYWWKNVRQPVRFSEAIDTALVSGEQVFLEIGPHPSMRSPILDCLAARKSTGKVAYSLKRDSDDSVELARNLAELHIAGIAIDWKSYLGTAPDPEIRLPGYAWHRKRYWIESPSFRRHRLDPADHPFLGRQEGDPSPTWETLLDHRDFPFLQDHQFWNRIVFPATGFAEIGLAVGKQESSTRKLVVENLEMKQILFLDRSQALSLRTEFDREDSRFRIFGRQSGSESWTLHATGRLPQRPGQLDGEIDLSSIRDRLPGHLAHFDLYDGFEKAGYGFGPRFSQVEQVWFGKGQALARISVPHEILDELERYVFHPAVLDSCFHAVSAASFDGDNEEERPLMLPSSVGRIHIDAELPPARFWVHAEITDRDADSTVSHLRLYDDAGSQFGDIRRFELRKVANDKTFSLLDDCFYRFVWSVSDPEDETNGDDNFELQKGTPLPAEKRQVVIFSDTGGVGTRLQDALESLGHSTIVVTSGEAYEQESEFRFVVQTGNSEHLEPILAIGEDQETIIVHLWCLDHPTDEELVESSLRQSQETGVYSLLTLTKTVERYRNVTSVFCVAATDSGPENDPTFRLSSSGLLGFLRVASSELSHLFWKSILLDATSIKEAGKLLVDELAQTDTESEVAFRDNQRLVRRLQPVRSEDLPHRTIALELGDGNEAGFQLENRNPGTLDKIEVNEMERLPVSGNFVEVRVKAAGVNFRDLLKVLGTYPGSKQDLEELGDEFSGVVNRVGPDVTQFQVGDEVVGFYFGCFLSHVRTIEPMLFPKSANHSFADAATILIVFMTAEYAINHLARLKPGDSILIHAAAGGVGHAAIQIAKEIGLEIFATAGSDEKRQILRDLGVEHIMDSRSLAFADEVMEITGGRGVDAVLNSLSGEFLLKSLSVLAPFGTFLEIGKIDIFADRRIGLHVLRNNISLHTIDLDQLIRSRPDVAEAVFSGLRERFESGRLQPLPSEVFPASEAAGAFRKMARGEHSGKLVLDFSAEEITVGKLFKKGALFSADATYLVSGGANGFGFEVAKWLARNGARHVALLSRSGPKSESVREEINELNSKGFVFRDERVDITDGAAVMKAIASVEQDLPPVGGVVHAAMVLDNRALSDLDRDSFATAFDPKAYGAWNLHSSTSHRDLEFFICFSSFASVVGAFKQANYNAGNTFLDELCHYRRGLGLEALSINWGSLSGAGYVEREAATREYLEAIGVKAFSIENVLEILENLLRRDVPQVTAANVEWNTAIHLSPAISRLPLYEAVAKSRSRSFLAGTFRPLILAAPSEQQPGMVEEFIAAQIAEVFGSAPDSIDPNVPVTELGLDSLMAIELLNRIESELGIQFPIGNFLGGPSIKDLAKPILESLLTSSVSAAPIDESQIDEEASSPDPTEVAAVADHRADTHA